MSPFRVKDILMAKTLDEYIVLNLEQKSSAVLSYLAHFLTAGMDRTYGDLPPAGQDDVTLFYVLR
jgi:hypothetical protein